MVDIIDRIGCNYLIFNKFLNEKSLKNSTKIDPNNSDYVKLHSDQIDSFICAYFYNLSKFIYYLTDENSDVRDTVINNIKQIMILQMEVLNINFENPCGITRSETIKNSNKNKSAGYYNAYKELINSYNTIITKDSKNFTENHCICLLALLYFLMYITIPLKYCGTDTDKSCDYSQTFRFDGNTSFRFDLVLSNTLTIVELEELNKINDGNYVITLIMFILSNINKRITDLDIYRSDYKQFYYNDNNKRLYYFIFDSLMKLIGRQNCYCYPGWKNLIDYFNNNVFNFDFLKYINSRSVDPIINTNSLDTFSEDDYVRARACVAFSRHIYITDTTGSYSDFISPTGIEKASECDAEEIEKEKKAEEKKAEAKKEAEETEEPIEGPAKKRSRTGGEPPITGGLNAYYKYLTYKYEKYFK